MSVRRTPRRSTAIWRSAAAGWRLGLAVGACLWLGSSIAAESSSAGSQAAPVATLAPVIQPNASAQASAVPNCPQLIASGNPQYPPYLWRNPDDEQQLVGANAALMQWLSREIGVPIETRYVGPWGRVQEEVRAGRVDLIAGAFFTLPRTEYMDYFHPAFRETRSVIWAREDRPLNFKRLNDLIGRQGVTVINNSFGVEFDDFARQSLKLTHVASIEQAIQMVQRGRADYMVYEDAPAEAYAARLGAPSIKVLTPAVAREGLYLTLSHRSRCNSPELRGRLARAVYKLSQDKALMNRWVEQAQALWRRQPAP